MKKSIKKGVKNGVKFSLLYLGSIYSFIIGLNRWKNFLLFNWIGILFFGVGLVILKYVFCWFRKLVIFGICVVGVYFCNNINLLFVVCLVFSIIFENFICEWILVCVICKERSFFFVMVVNLLFIFFICCFKFLYLVVSLFKDIIGNLIDFIFNLGNVFFLVMVMK